MVWWQQPSPPAETALVVSGFVFIVKFEGFRFNPVDSIGLVLEVITFLFIKPRTAAATTPTNGYPIVTRQLRQFFEELLYVPRFQLVAHPETP